MSSFTIQWLAIEWLNSTKGVKLEELYRGDTPGDPDFIYKGHYGYEIKTLHGKSISFERGRYNSLRDWDGEVLVFRAGDDKPKAIIPFGKLPVKGGQCMNVNILIREAGSNRAMIALNANEKVELERMRGEIETKILPQDDWADMLLQAMCAMLCDVELIRFCYANRMGIKHFIACCPHCDTDNTIEGRYRLYWMLECSYCKRRFVAKRRITKKTAAD